MANGTAMYKTWALNLLKELKMALSTEPCSGDCAYGETEWIVIRFCFGDPALKKKGVCKRMLVSCVSDLHYPCDFE